jgi:hypothetical protein
MEGVWAAAVTGAFGLLMLIVERGRRENIRDHGFVKDRLDSLKENLADIDEDLTIIESKIDGHLLDHVSSSLKKSKK